jgi:uncharacterized membrane protein
LTAGRRAGRPGGDPRTARGGVAGEREARSDYQAIRQAHVAGLVGSYDAAVITKDAAGRVHQNKDETATRHGAWWGIAAGAAKTLREMIGSI